MLHMVQDLVGHKGYASAVLLKAIQNHEVAAQDGELRKLLHHVILANRFWLALTLGRAFNHQEETRALASLEEVMERYRETHILELEWVSAAQECDLDRMLETPFIPGCSFSVAQATMQVCMHSHGHRAQCSMRLRSLGGTPPAMDFVWWLKDRPAADWL
jgi:uncharacterized damage-inducible protein DinB